jgi:hypothetical protein
MNPNPLSISSLAIVPVGIPESPPSDDPFDDPPKVGRKGGQSRQYALGSQYRRGYVVVGGLGGAAVGAGFGETFPVVVVGAFAAVPVAGAGAAAAAGFSLFGGGYVVQKCRAHFGQTQY